MTVQESAIDILDFWWRAGEAAWFRQDDAFDKAITDRFLTRYEEAANGDLDAWRQDPAGTLALLLLLDQFPRNMFRGSARAFATDGKARDIANAALEQGFDRTFPVPQRAFFYLPFMHSENIADQIRCVDLCRTLGSRDQYHFALIHKDAIDRFGRFPHRNHVLGRPSTPAEAAYLESGGFTG